MNSGCKLISLFVFPAGRPISNPIGNFFHYFLRMVGKWKNIHIRIIDNNYGRYNYWSTIRNFKS
jgi:hypothetical protein